MNDTANYPVNDGTLRVRVDTLAEDMRGFHIDLRNVQAKMATREDIAAIGSQITQLAARQEAGGKPNWQMWGVAVTILGLLGAVLYWPINRDTSRLDIAVAAILDKGVFQKQYDSDQLRLSSTLTTLRNDVNIGIQQQRYNTDQVRVTESFRQLDEQIQFVRKSFVRIDDNEKQLTAMRTLVDRNAAEISLLRDRSYTDQSRISKLEEMNRNLEKTQDLHTNRINELRKVLGK